LAGDKLNPRPDIIYFMLPLIYKKNVDQIGFIYYILFAKSDSPPREGKLPQ
jgi:hypothetical protein